MKKWKGFIYIIAVFMAGCKKPYTPSAITAPGSYLVVEGAITSGSDSTVIKLSHTVNLSNKITTRPVFNALLTIESDQNESFPLAQAANGLYVSAGLNLDNTHKYRLRIRTADNKEYLSDFVSVINSPPIDSVSYAIKSNGIQIYTSTHDPKNNTKYYRWDYQETWQFHSNYYSYFLSNGDKVIPRDLVNNQVYNCWGTDSSTTVLVGSTAKLSKDVIDDNPINFIASTSEKLGTKYSILVKQYALTADAYNFWVNLKKNSEQLGTIFDAQPSEIKGNIHSVTNPSEPVIGYLGVGAIASQRIFITIQQLPDWSTIPTYTDCSLDTVYLSTVVAPNDTIKPEDQYFNYNKNGGITYLIPVSAVKGTGGTGYLGSLPKCVDCTLRGTNKRPFFWK